MSSSDAKQPDYQPNGRKLDGTKGQSCGRCGCQWFRIFPDDIYPHEPHSVATECQRCGHIAQT